MDVIIITASVPMLRPIWSRRGGKDYSSSSNKNAYDAGGSRHIRFGKLSGGQKPAPGQYTVALDNLDGAEARTERQSNDAGSHGGSSVENILPKSPEPAAYGSAPNENSIRITNEVHVGYSQTDRAKMPSDRFNGGRMTQHHAFGRSGR